MKQPTEAPAVDLSAKKKEIVTSTLASLRRSRSVQTVRLKFFPTTQILPRCVARRPGPVTGDDSANKHQLTTAEASKTGNAAVPDSTAGKRTIPSILSNAPHAQAR